MAFVLLAALALQDPPKGTSWKMTAAAGVEEAGKRGAPILVFVFDKGYEDAVKLNASFEDPKVAAVLKVFVCVYLCAQKDFEAYKTAFVPWMGSDAGSQFLPPLVSFGDSKGGVHEDLKLEGKALEPEDLLKHLIKAIEKLAPEKAEQARIEMMNLKTPEEILADFDASIGKLIENLAPDRVGSLNDELKTTNTIVKVVENKLGAIKDKKQKSEALKQLGDIKKTLEKTAKFKGKDIPGYKAPLEKAKEAIAAFKSLSESK